MSKLTAQWRGFRNGLWINFFVISTHKQQHQPKLHCDEIPPLFTIIKYLMNLNLILHSKGEAAAKKRENIFHRNNNKSFALPPIDGLIIILSLLLFSMKNYRRGNREWFFFFLRVENFLAKIHIATAWMSERKYDDIEQKKHKHHAINNCRAFNDE